MDFQTEIAEIKYQVGCRLHFVVVILDILKVRSNIGKKLHTRKKLHTWEISYMGRRGIRSGNIVSLVTASD